MSKELLAALAGAESEDDAAGALSAALEASYTSHPREGVSAALTFLQRKADEREKARQEQAAAAAQAEAKAAEQERIAAANRVAEQNAKVGA